LYESETAVGGPQEPPKNFPLDGHTPEANVPSSGVKTRTTRRTQPHLDMHPLRVAERIRSHARDRSCALSKDQVVADAEWNLLAWQFLYGDPEQSPVARKRLALLEAADACDQLGEHREAKDLRDWASTCEGCEVAE
jgi:hypothetical protein